MKRILLGFVLVGAIFAAANSVSAATPQDHDNYQIFTNIPEVGQRIQVLVQHNKKVLTLYIRQLQGAQIVQEVKIDAKRNGIEAPVLAQCVTLATFAQSTAGSSLYVIPNGPRNGIVCAAD